MLQRFSKFFIYTLTIYAGIALIASCSPKGYNVTQRAINNQDSILINCDCFNCINDVDSGYQKKLLQKNKKLIQIYLIRHAKPDIQKKKLYTAQQAEQYIHNYNLVPIQDFDKNLIKINLFKKHTVYCSSLRRSIETANKIFQLEYNIISDTIFKEFENNIIKAPKFIYQSLFLWQVMSRGSWILGRKNSKIESHKEALFRAKKATSKLVEIAKVEETAILVAHGMLNRSITKNLKKNGWTIIQKNGMKNLGATVLVKVIDLN